MKKDMIIMMGIQMAKQNNSATATIEQCKKCYFWYFIFLFHEVSLKFTVFEMYYKDKQNSWLFHYGQCICIRKIH